MPKGQPVEYEASEPAFLRRLKAGHAGLDGRNNVQTPRARGGIGRNSRLNMGGEEGEDDPVMIDEAGNEVSKEDMKALEKCTLDNTTAGASENEQVESLKTTDEPQVKEVKEPHVSSGFGKKRKAIKVVAEDEADGVRSQNEEGETENPAKSLKESTQDLKDVVAQAQVEAQKETGIEQRAKKGKKKKKIKLSFDDPE